MNAKVSQLPKKSNFDKRPRFLVHGLGPIVIVESVWSDALDAYDERKAREVADNIANAFNNPNIFGRGHDET